ncbi:MAG: hypothetical protein JETT_3926 [Candidatus Jettenia ecosi]|uniref:Sel1 repeat family protein n=1 Tax=Candidatus Jettenia ecosi TaxID=2494326 RepID=A0A533Q5K5_9BACT|nr:MAG: hypothetical protein JETT_3926 [Candidatus Jettenia ecosi]
MLIHIRRHDNKRKEIYVMVSEMFINIVLSIYKYQKAGSLIRGTELFVGWPILILAGCAGMNPNPGEHTADMAWERGDYTRALSLIRPSAQRGEPWAQVRMGVAYELGVGVTKNTQEAIAWYRKAAAQIVDGGWAEGKLVGAKGKAGYFNQNSDALIAIHQISGLYLRGDGVPKDLVEAYLWAKYVSDKSGGKSIFYCCEFLGGRWITADAIAATLRQIQAEMTLQQARESEEKYVGWRPL